MVAEQIVAHLKRSNWRFVKGSPLPRHGQPQKGRVATPPMFLFFKLLGFGIAAAADVNGVFFFDQSTEANSSNCFSLIDSYMPLRALEFSHRSFTAFGGKSGPSRLLLRLRFCWHIGSPP